MVVKLDNDNSTEARFIAYLDDLRATDAAALAALRRGLGARPGESPDTFRYVVPWISETTTRWVETVYYMVASLYALHKLPSTPDGLDFGSVLAKVADPDNMEATEKRFQLLITAHPDDLHVFFRQVIQLVKEIPIDWARLIRDLKGWNHDSQYVQHGWARSFWSSINKKPQEKNGS